MKRLSAMKAALTADLEIELGRTRRRQAELTTAAQHVDSPTRTSTPKPS